jgi:sec-independent protein translocase protein TatA
MNTLAIFGNLAGPDMLIIFLIVLIMFGAKKLPELAKGLGQAVKEFSKAKEDVTTELHRVGQVDVPSYHHAEHAPLPPSQPAHPAAAPQAAGYDAAHASHTGHAAQPGSPAPAHVDGHAPVAAHSQPPVPSTVPAAATQPHA